MLGQYHHQNIRIYDKYIEKKKPSSWDLGRNIILGFVRIRVWGIYEFDGYVASEFIVDTITTVNSESLQRTNAQQVRAEQKEELLKQGVNSLVGGGWLWHHLRRADQEDWQSSWGECSHVMVMMVMVVVNFEHFISDQGKGKGKGSNINNILSRQYLIKILNILFLTRWSGNWIICLNSISSKCWIFFSHQVIVTGGKDTGLKPRVADLVPGSWAQRRWKWKWKWLINASKEIVTTAQFWQ